MISQFHKTSFMKIVSFQVTRTVKAKYIHFKEHQQMTWCQKALYLNVGLLLEILLVFLGSSSVVKRGFSTVRSVLRENRLSMKN